MAGPRVARGLAGTVGGPIVAHTLGQLARALAYHVKSETDREAKFYALTRGTSLRFSGHSLETCARRIGDR